MSLWKNVNSPNNVFFFVFLMHKIICQSKDDLDIIFVSVTHIYFRAYSFKLSMHPYQACWKSHV